MHLCTLLEWKAKLYRKAGNLEFPKSENIFFVRFIADEFVYLYSVYTYQHKFCASDL